MIVWRPSLAAVAPAAAQLQLAGVERKISRGAVPTYMPGRVVAVLAAEGAEVTAGQA